MKRTGVKSLVAVSVLMLLNATAVSAQVQNPELQGELKASQTQVRAMPQLSGIDPRALDAAISGKGITQLVSPQAAAQAPKQPNPSFFTGMMRTACEAMLCLSAIGEAPGECAKALTEYHAMQMFGMGNSFLLMCPTQQVSQ